MVQAAQDQSRSGQNNPTKTKSRQQSLIQQQQTLVIKSASAQWTSRGSPRDHIC